jgi:uncharacterized membrane protein
MTDPVVAMAVYAALFIGAHLVISSSVVRPRLIAIVGERAYPGIYSLVVLGAFVLLVSMFAYHKHSGAMLWDLRGVTPIRWIVWIAMLLAFIIFVASFINPNPGSMSAQGRKVDPGTAVGILKISRHPGFVAFSIFGLAHMLMNGFIGDVIFFGTFPALSIIGGLHQDQRQEAKLGAPYHRLVEQTSFVPGLALIQGRQHWTSADTPWIAIAIGIVLTIVIVWLHPTIFGGYPLGFAW